MRRHVSSRRCIGGLVIGVLSALPFISAGNCCCCLWFVTGGVLAAYLMQQNQPASDRRSATAHWSGCCRPGRRGRLGHPLRADSTQSLVPCSNGSSPNACCESAGDMPPESARDARERASGPAPAVLRSRARLRLHADRRRGVRDARRAARGARSSKNAPPPARRPATAGATAAARAARAASPLNRRRHASRRQSTVAAQNLRPTRDVMSTVRHPASGEIETLLQRGSPLPPAAGVPRRRRTCATHRHLRRRRPRSRSVLGRLRAASSSGQRPWTKVLDGSRRTRRWFVGGKLNASVNCVDRHVARRAAQQGGAHLGRRAGRPPHAHLLRSVPAGQSSSRTC